MPPLLREPRYLPFVLALLIALLVVPELPSPAVRPTSGWRGWYVLLYRSETASAVEAALAAWDPRAASRSSATVRIDAFSEIQTLPVRAIDERLDGCDPRRDRWLSGVGGYFQGRDDEAGVLVAYLPATRGRMATWLGLRRLLRGRGVTAGWRLVEFDPAAMAAALAGTLGFAIAVAATLHRGAHRRLPLAALGALAFLPNLMNGGLADVCFCCLALYLWILAAVGGEPRERRSSSEARRTGLRIGVLLAVGALVVATGGAPLYRAARMAAGLASLELLAGLKWPFARRHPRLPRAGRRFPPVPALAPRTPAAVPLAAALVAALLVGLPAGLSRVRFPLPRPMDLEPTGNPAGAQAARVNSSVDRLPGLADAVVHAASLQTFAFERIGPSGAGTASGPMNLAMGGRVRLLEYENGSGDRSLVEAPRTVSQFDPGWVRRTLEGFPAGTVERLLLDQRRAVEAQPRSPWAPVRTSLPAVLGCLIVMGVPLAGPSTRRHLKRLGLWGITEPARSPGIS